MLYSCDKTAHCVSVPGHKFPVLVFVSLKIMLSCFFFINLENNNKFHFLFFFVHLNENTKTMSNTATGGGITLTV